MTVFPVLYIMREGASQEEKITFNKYFTGLDSV